MHKERYKLIMGLPFSIDNASQSQCCKCNNWWPAFAETKDVTNGWSVGIRIAGTKWSTRSAGRAKSLAIGCAICIAVCATL